jgi:hypothetical protein
MWLPTDQIADNADYVKRWTDTQLEGAAVADLADDDPVGAEAHRVHDRSLPGVDGGLDQDLDLVRRSALELRVVLDQVHAVTWERPRLVFVAAS